MTRSRHLTLLTSGVYADAGANPDPSTRQMIDQQVLAGPAATVAIDICPTDLHAALVS